MPPNVYHVRRLIVLAVLLGVVVGIFGIVSAFVGGGSDSPKATSSTSKATTVSACDPASVVITANTDHESYGEGELPQLSMTITNTSEVACTIEVGTDKQKYTIASGSDQIWDSTVCQTSKEAFVQEFKAGESITTNTFEWGRARSDNCDNGTPAVGGGASYNLSVQLGDVTSKKTVQFMLY